MLNNQILFCLMALKLYPLIPKICQASTNVVPCNLDYKAFSQVIFYLFLCFVLIILQTFLFSFITFKPSLTAVPERFKFRFFLFLPKMTTFSANGLL